MTEIETDRLRLGRWRPDDLDQLAGVFSKDRVWWFPFKRGWTRQETAGFLDRKIAEWARRGWAEWAVEVKEAKALIGHIGLSPPEFLPEVMPTVEVGWRLEPDWWGKGLATEGGRAALAYGFEVLDLHEVVSIYEPENVASGKVMARLGKKPDRETVHPTLNLPLRVFKITRKDWTVS